MSIFRILVVDDDPRWTDTLQDNLPEVSPKELTGKDYDRYEFTLARDQVEATAAVDSAGADGYDLVLLDLVYPEQPNGEVDEDEGPYQGMKWLPHLRAAQPNAAIVILTAYPHEKHLWNVVIAVRDHQVDDFLPKTAPFAEIVARISQACEKARRRRELTLCQDEFHAMRQSLTGPVYAEHMMIMLQNHKRTLSVIAQQMESAEHATEDYAERIRVEAGWLIEQFLNLSDLLYRGKRPCRKADIFALLWNTLALYGRVAEKAGISIVGPDNAASLFVKTYESDLKIVLHEVIHNAVEVLGDHARQIGHPELRVTVRSLDSGCEIRILDNGPGFAPHVLEHLGEMGVSTWNDGKHQGIGLHIAKWLMENGIGQFFACNRPEGGAEIRLIVGDLP